MFIAFHLKILYIKSYDICIDIRIKDFLVVPMLVICKFDGDVEDNHILDNREQRIWIVINIRIDSINNLYIRNVFTANNRRVYWMPALRWNEETGWLLHSTASLIITKRKEFTYCLCRWSSQ